MKGTLYLIPVTLGGSNIRMVIPDGVITITNGLRVFIVEDLRSARRYLRLLDKDFPIDQSEFFVIDKHGPDSDISHFLDPLRNGKDIGLMSEAGQPAIADPGNRIIEAAHREGIRVVPLSGPSSILMALIASGLNGQHFTFNGYLPVKPDERASKLRELERMASRGVAQVFMETPYRNAQIFKTITEVCKSTTMLCIACDISLESESIITLQVGQWKKINPDLKDKLVVFVLQ